MKKMKITAISLLFVMCLLPYSILYSGEGLMKAKQKHMNGDYHGAMRLLTRHLENDPGSQYGNYLAGEASFMIHGASDTSIHYFQKASKGMNSNITYNSFMNLAMNYLMLERPTESLTNAYSALHMEDHEEIGKRADRLKKIIIEAHSMKLKIQDNEARRLYIKAMSHFEKNQIDRAESFIKKALEQENACILHLMLGRIYSGRKQYDRAIKEYSTAISLHAYYPDAYCERGYCYYVKENMPKALSNINQGLDYLVNRDTDYYRYYHSIVLKIST